MHGAHLPAMRAALLSFPPSVMRAPACPAPTDCRCNRLLSCMPSLPSSLPGHQRHPAPAAGPEAAAGGAPRARRQRQRRERQRVGLVGWCAGEPSRTGQAPASGAAPADVLHAARCTVHVAACVGEDGGEGDVQQGGLCCTVWTCCSRLPRFQIWRTTARGKSWGTATTRWTRLTSSEPRNLQQRQPGSAGQLQRQPDNCRRSRRCCSCRQPTQRRCRPPPCRARAGGCSARRPSGRVATTRTTMRTTVRGVWGVHAVVCGEDCP